MLAIVARDMKASYYALILHRDVCPHRHILIDFIDSQSLIVAAGIDRSGYAHIVLGAAEILDSYAYLSAMRRLSKKYFPAECGSADCAAQLLCLKGSSLSSQALSISL